MSSRSHSIDELLSAIRPPVDLMKAKSILDAGADPNGYSDNGATPLYDAAFFCEAEAIDLLLMHGANPDIELSPFKQSPLMMAAGRGQRGNACIQLLIKAGATIDKVDADGFTALFFAIGSSNLDAVLALLAAGANPNVRNSSGSTPLYWVIAKSASSAVMQCLLANGADKNEKVAVHRKTMSLSEFAKIAGRDDCKELLN